MLGDGNCLPYSGSVIAFGNQDHGEEMRVRIVVEMVLHKDLYLSESHLKKGLVQCQTLNSISKTYAMFSEEYMPGKDTVGKANIEEIYKKEALKITRPGSFMGMWQLCALSSVLGKRLVSVHPKKGNLNIRNDLHRTIEPRVYSVNPQECAYIMWTSARDDMKKGHWQANHFVPLLAFEQDNITGKLQKSSDQNAERSSVKNKGLDKKVSFGVEKIIAQRNALLGLRKSKKESKNN